MSISFLAEWEPDPLWRAEVYLAVFQVFMTGRGRIFSKEDVGKVANANGICLAFDLLSGKQNMCSLQGELKFIILDKITHTW